MLRLVRLYGPASILVALALCSVQPTVRAELPGPGPSFNFPKNGQTLDYEGDYIVEVAPVPGASGYLWAFSQNGKILWENHRDERQLSGNRYVIRAGSAAWKRFRPGKMIVGCRAYINNDWTKGTNVCVVLRAKQ